MFDQHDVNLNSLLNGEESVGFLKGAWTAAGGEGDESEDSIAAKLKAIRSLNTETGESFSWEDYARSMKILTIWLEKGKAKEELKTLMEEQMKSMPPEMRSMM